MYRQVGVLLALLIGCSQQWIVELFGKYLPDDYVAQFTTPTVISYVETLDAPQQNSVFVFTDIESSSDLWALADGAIMRQAHELHDDILRSCLLKFNGYEITTAGDAFQLAFHRIEDAVNYCVEVQLQLLHAKWPKTLRTCGVPGASRENVNGKTILDGLRVRMGIHDAQENVEGPLVCVPHAVTGKTTHTGLSQVIADKVGDIGHGGQLVMTARVAQWVQSQQGRLAVECHAVFLSRYCLPSVNESIDTYQLVVISGLEARLEVFRRAYVRRFASCSQLV